MKTSKRIDLDWSKLLAFDLVKVGEAEKKALKSTSATMFGAKIGFFRRA